MIESLKKALPSLPKHWQSIDMIAGGVMLYTLSTGLFMHYLPQALCWALDCLSLLMFVYGLTHRKTDENVDLFVRLMATYMLLYGVVSVLLGTLDNEFKLAHLITQPSYVLFLVFPILLFFPPTPDEMERVYKWLYVGLFLCFVHLSLNIYSFVFKTNEVWSSFFVDDGNFGMYFHLAKVTVACGYILAISMFFVCKSIVNRSQSLVIFLTIIMSALSSLSFGRRSSTVFVLAVLVMQLLFTSLFVKRKNYLAILAGFLIIGLIFANVSEIIDMFPILSDRLMDDTRSGVEEDFWRSTTSTSLLFGKGIHGVYSSEGDERNMIETGYLYYMLKEGVIYLGMFVLLMLYAAIRGIMSSCNMLKACSFYLVFSVMSLYPGGIPAFNISNYMIYLTISICCNSSWRNYRSDIYVDGRSN